LDKSKKIDFVIEKSKGVYVFVIEGKCKVNETELNKRNSAEITEHEKISFNAIENSEIFIIEIPE